MACYLGLVHSHRRFARQGWRHRVASAQFVNQRQRLGWRSRGFGETL